ncbi:MAG: hypothetical protein JXO22_07580 [Phycisphaerae bacterium]|nr:hypothetical protein [Phycisphaerae bacterium]
MRQQRGRLMRAGVMIAALVMCVTPALAASDDDPAKTWREPGISKREHSTPWAQWLAATLFTAGCLVTAFKNPHRSHLD